MCFPLSEGVCFRQFLWQTGVIIVFRRRPLGTRNSKMFAERCETYSRKFASYRLLAELYPNWENAVGSESRFSLGLCNNLLLS